MTRRGGTKLLKPFFTWLILNDFAIIPHLEFLLRIAWRAPEPLIAMQLILLLGPLVPRPALSFRLGQKKKCLLQLVPEESTEYQFVLVQERSRDGPTLSLSHGNI